VREYEFEERLIFSEGVKLNNELLLYLVSLVPEGVEILKADKEEDIQGVDYWIIRRGTLKPIAVDIKHRSFDPIILYNKDDICIETTSVYTGDLSRPFLDIHRQKIGWTLDSQKQTDLIVYTWPAAGDKRRFWVLYFPFLCKAARKHWREWAEVFGEVATKNKGYYTLNIFVPRQIVEQAIKNLTDSTVCL